jgi:hypothetical protein
MQTIELATVASEQTTQIAGRERRVQRLIDLQAAAEAAVALHSAAGRPSAGVAANALFAADEILAGGTDSTVREQLRTAVTANAFGALVRSWSRELRGLASATPDTGACTIATALNMWAWTFDHFRKRENAVAVEDLVDGIIPLLAARSLAVEVADGSSELQRDLSHVYAARVSAQTAATCAELVYGYRSHPQWDAEGCATCYASDELDELEAFIPGIASGARTSIDIIEADGSHPLKEGPCARFDGLDTFVRLRNRLDGCLTGARIARDRVAAAIAAQS